MHPRFWRLKSAGGRNILLSAGTDTLIGAGGDDILIGGKTIYDLNKAALTAIFTEWRSGDNYATRISHLRNGGGLNGAFKLNSTSVLTDTTADSLSGGAGLDWFWAFTNDTITDRNTGGTETVN